MTRRNPFETIKVSGSNYEIGFQIGIRFKNKIKKTLRQSKRLKFLKKVDEKNPKKFDELNSIGQKYFPKFMEEIEGIAEGSGIEYRDIAIMNFMAAYREGCTTIVCKQRDRIILGHNEDGAKENLETSFLVIAKPKNGIPFFSFCYPGTLPGGAFSFNSKGFVQTSNWMPTPDLRVGIPIHLIDRYLLEAKNINDALKRALLRRRASGFSYTMVTRKKALNLETTSQKSSITKITDSYIHTNHYISARLKSIKQKIYKSSLIRYEKGVRMIKEINDTSSSDILGILSYPGIFSKVGHARSCTLCTALFEISSKGVNLKIYSPKQIKDGKRCMRFSLNDLK